MKTEATNKILTAIAQTFLLLKNNLADILLLVGIILIGIFIYKTYGINPTIFYSGIVFVVASFVFGFTTKPKDTGRKY